MNVRPLHSTPGRPRPAPMWLCLPALVLAGLAAPPAAAELFCVSTPAQLQAALGVAGSNAQDDEIRIRAGTYAATSPGFKYEPVAGENRDIRISGGWRPYILGPCSLQDKEPWTTVLDGNGASRILSMLVQGIGADVRVDRLTFLGGNLGGFSAAGLDIRYANGASGSVVVERNVFLGNESSLAAGLGIDADGPKASVVNNLFVSNRGLSNFPAASVVNVGGPAHAIVFTNNTVIGNDLGGSPSANAAAVYLASPNVFAANNNFWDNDGHDLDAGGSGTRLIFNNNYESLRSWGGEQLEDNIGVQPVYQSGLLNFTPVRNSPLVDAGTEPRGLDPGWYLTDADLEGAPRQVGLRVDIGALENETIFANGFQSPGPFGNGGAAE